MHYKYILAFCAMGIIVLFPILVYLVLRDKPPIEDMEEDKEINLHE